jgi:2,3-bisphosphoglycerate-independent phosphoglycerate mutase
MKYVVLLGDGMADHPMRELGGRTPLQAAFTPNMDKIAASGIRGSIRTIPGGFSPGSDVANMNILGYDPKEFYSGRAPLEAASMGIELEKNQVAYRCNFVTLKFKKDLSSAVMDDYSAGHITSDEAEALIDILNRKITRGGLQFYPGVSYRHLMVWTDGEVGADCTPPHDILDKDIAKYLPTGKGSEFLNTLMRDSVEILQKHAVNKRRISENKNPANSIWLWGQGRKPAFTSFKEKYGIEGSVVSAVDLIKGLGISAGLNSIDVPGATGYLDTNYEGKARYALNSLKERDFVYLHVEAPDEAGHMGRVNDKITAIEDFDTHIVGPVLIGLKKFGDFRVLLLPDHATPVSLRTHTDEPVPFVLYDSTNIREAKGMTYDEGIGKEKGIYEFPDGHKLMDFFIKSEIS